MRDIKIQPTEHARYKWQLIVPKAMFGKRQRLSFSSKTAAQSKQRQLEAEYRGSKLAPLMPEHHLCAARYQNQLTASQMEEALARAVGHYGLSGKSFSDLATEFKDQGKRLFERGAIGDHMWKDIRIRTPRLIEWMGETTARDITQQDVEDFVDDRVADGFAPRTIKNFVSLLSAIMKSGVEQGSVAVNMVPKVSLPKISGEVTILAPKELKTLIETASSLKALKARGSDVSLMLAWIMFGAFGGLRTSETRRLQWEDIRMDEDQFYVRPGKTANAERWVAITPPLKHYLEQMLETKRKGAVLLNRAAYSLYEHQKKLHDAAGIKIPQHALRHSYGSHHLVEYDNPANTATEMGHWSPQQTFKSYRRAVPKSQAAKYWKLRVGL